MYPYFWLKDSFEKEMETLRRHFDGSNNTVYRRNWSSTPNRRVPISDTFVTDKEVSITVELPGVDKNEINLNVDMDKIEIESTGKRKYHDIIEWSTSIDDSSVTATFANGVLDVVAQRLGSPKKGRKIDVN